MSDQIEPAQALTTIRRFTIFVRYCKRCRREWPARMDTCLECGVSLGAAVDVPCERMVVLGGAPPPSTSLVAVLAIELVSRGTTDGEWAAMTWNRLSELGAARVPRLSAPAGTLVLVWPVARDGLQTAAEFALRVGETWPQGPLARIELRGALAIGVLTSGSRTAATVRETERLALAAWRGQWLCGLEVARRLQPRFAVGGSQLVPRWPIASTITRVLLGHMTPPKMPSAIDREQPGVVLGRGIERARILTALRRPDRRRTLLVSADAGGGKSHLLRDVVMTAGLTVSAGVAFPPLGGAPADPIEALIAQLGGDRDNAPSDLGARLARAVSAAAQKAPVLVVVDDVHWGDSLSLQALREAIIAVNAQLPVTWLLAARTAELERLRALTGLADLEVALPPLAGEDRVRLLKDRLGEVPANLIAHVRANKKRGNPLYLEHLAAVISEGGDPAKLPDDLHEAVFARLDGLVRRVRALTRWENRTTGPELSIESLEREVADWLDRLETSDLADVATIGRYLDRLRQVDSELVVARVVLRMPVTVSSRLAQVIERLSTASTGALVDYLNELAARGRGPQAVAEAKAAASRAEFALRLADAEALLVFAAQHAEAPGPLLRRHGDIALARGKPESALAVYAEAQRAGEPAAGLQRRIARAEATAARHEDAVRRLSQTWSGSVDAAETEAARLDACRLRGEAPTATDGPDSAPRRRVRARVAALAEAGDSALAYAAAEELSLDGDPLSSAVELIETAVVAALGGIEVAGLVEAARLASRTVGGGAASTLLSRPTAELARHTFLHAEV